MLYCKPECRLTNAEKCKARYHRNRAKFRAMQNDYYARNRDHIRKRLRNWAYNTRLVTPWKGCLSSAKTRAKQLKLPFDLTEEWAKSVWTGRCALSGIEFQIGVKAEGTRMWSPSVDRIDPKLGYAQSNCRFILFAVNCLKQNGTDADVFNIAAALMSNKA